MKMKSILIAIVLAISVVALSRDFHPSSGQRQESDRLRLTCIALNSPREFRSLELPARLRQEIEMALRQIDRQKNDSAFEADILTEMYKGVREIESFMESLPDEAFFNPGNYPRIAAYYCLTNRARIRGRSRN